MYRAGMVRAKGHPRYRCFGMPRLESLILRPILEKGRLGAVSLSHAALAQLRHHPPQVEALICIKRSAQRHEQQAVLRADALDLQRPVEALAQDGGKGQRSAQIQYPALDRPSLSQACDGLVHHGLIDAGRDVRRPGALVDQGLDVALGEHAAAGGDGISFFRLLGSLIHLIGAHLQQRRHLVDEGPGAAGTRSVHADLCSIGEENELGILAPQLDDDIRPGSQLIGSYPGREHLLYEGHAHTVRHAHTCRAGDRQLGLSAGDVLLCHPAQQLLRLFDDMAVMPLVCTVYDPFIIVQHHALDGGRADIKADLHCRPLLLGRPPPPADDHELPC